MEASTFDFVSPFFAQSNANVTPKNTTSYQGEAFAAGSSEIRFISTGSEPSHAIRHGGEKYKPRYKFL